MRSQSKEYNEREEHKGLELNSYVSEDSVLRSLYSSLSKPFFLRDLTLSYNFYLFASDTQMAPDLIVFLSPRILCWDIFNLNIFLLHQI